MKGFVMSCVLLVNGFIGLQSHPEVNSGEKPGLSSLTTPKKVSSILRDILNQESVVRFSMVQRIQGLVMDVLDNKNNSQITKRRLQDIMSELQADGENVRKIEEENSKLQEELRAINETNRKLEEDIRMLNQELITLKEESTNNKNLTMEKIQHISEREKFLEKKIVNIQSANEDLSMKNSELNRTLKNTITKDQFDVFKNDFNLRLQMIDASLQNVSLSVNKTVEDFVSEQRNGYKDSSRDGSYLDCKEILEKNLNLRGMDGVYNIVPNKTSVRVYCDMTTDGGGWTVIQRRFDGKTDFHRKWDDYEKGFGEPNSEYWLGNDKIHDLTDGRNQELRIDMRKFSGSKVYARYSQFSVGNKFSSYQLSISGYSGNAGDMMINSYNLNGMYFSTKDRDNDQWSGGNCAVTYHTGAWWYNFCTYSDLNGVYQPSNKKNNMRLHWGSSGENMKTTKMMIRSKK